MGGSSMPVIGALGSMFIGRVTHRCDVRRDRLSQDIVDSEVAVMTALAAQERRLEALETQIRESIARREVRFDEFLNRLEDVSRTFLGAVEELHEEW